MAPPKPPEEGPKPPSPFTLAFIEAAKKMGKKAYFGHANAMESKAMARNFSIACNQNTSCHCKVFKRGEEVPLRKEAADMMTMLEQFVGEPVTELKTEAELAAFRKQPVAVVGFFKDRSAKEFLRFEETARKVRLFWELPKLGAVFGGETLGVPAIKAPSVVLYRKEDDATVLLTPATLPKTNLTDWIGYESFLLLEESIPGQASDHLKMRPVEPSDILRSQDKLSKMQSIGLPMVKVFMDDETIDDADDEYLAPLRQLAKEHRGKLTVLLHRKSMSSAYMVEDFGLNSDVLPKLGISVVSKAAVNGIEAEDPVLYGYTGDMKDGKAMVTWAGEVLAGKVAPSYRSQEKEALPEGEAHIPGTVRKLVAHDLEDAVFGEMDVVVCFHLPYGGDILHGALNKTAEVLQEVEGVVVAKFDSYKNEWDNTKFHNIATRHEGPVTFFCGGKDCATGLSSPKTVGGQLVQYKGDYNLKSLVNWVKKRSKKVKDKWGVVKEAMTDVLSTDKGARKALKQAEAELQALRDAAEPFDITGDGGVVKRTVKEGEGATPTFGSMVKFHHSGRITGDKGYKIDVPEEVTLELGRSKAIPGLQIGLARMKAGERAFVAIEGKYGYGKEGEYNLLIPPDANLEYDVTLLEFTPGDPNPPELEQMRAAAEAEKAKVQLVEDGTDGSSSAPAAEEPAPAKDEV